MKFKEKERLKSQAAGVAGALVVLGYLVMIPVSWALILGMMQAKDCAKGTLAYGYYSQRELLGLNTLFSGFASIAWPATLPFAYMANGFGEHGLMYDIPDGSVDWRARTMCVQRRNAALGG